MYIREGSVNFPLQQGSGPQVADHAVNFPGPVSNADAFLAGFNMEYADGDHHLQIVELDLQTRDISSQSIEVRGQYGLKDSSGDWDDKYVGSLRYVILGHDAMDTRSGTLVFPAAAGGGPQSQSENVQFNQSVDTAEVALTGFTAKFSGEDHHLLQLQVELSAQRPAPRRLEATGTYGLRDSSGNWDDSYEGHLGYTAVGVPSNKSPTLLLQSGRFDFGPQSGSGPRSQSDTIDFGRDIGDCAAAITGFVIAYDDNDHHIRRVSAEVEARKLSSQEIDVVGSFALRDDSGNWDDEYRGSIRYVVLAVAAPRP
jgi:hypothetical protein